MADTSFESICWPAFEFGSPDCSMTVCVNSDSFDSLSPASVRRICKMTEFYLIDSNGVRFDLTSPCFVREPTIFQLIFAMIIPSRWPVDWACVRRGRVDPEALKLLIAEDWEQYSDMWQATDLDSLETSLEAAEDYSEVFAVFLGD